MARGVLADLAADGGRLGGHGGLRAGNPLAGGALGEFLRLGAGGVRAAPGGRQLHEPDVHRDLCDRGFLRVPGELAVRVYRPLPAFAAAIQPGVRGERGGVLCGDAAQRLGGAPVWAAARRADVAGGVCGGAGLARGVGGGRRGEPDGGGVAAIRGVRLHRADAARRIGAGDGAARRRGGDSVVVDELAAAGDRHGDHGRQQPIRGWHAVADGDRDRRVRGGGIGVGVRDDAGARRGDLGRGNGGDNVEGGDILLAENLPLQPRRPAAVQ